VHDTIVCGSGSTAQTILKLRTRWRLVVGLMSRPLYPKERGPVPMEHKAGWAPEPPWSLPSPENLLPLPGIETRFLGRPACSLVYQVAYKNACMLFFCANKFLSAVTFERENFNLGMSINKKTQKSNTNTCLLGISSLASPTQKTFETFR
jgi:hypothetical protein